MKVLVACEYSGIVRDAFASAGHDSWSCDLLPSMSPGNHIIGDAIEVIMSSAWDLVIAHPPCTYLCKAQLFRCTPESQFEVLQQSAIEFFKKIYYSPVQHIAIENPIGALSKKFRPPDQIIYPWMFGDIHSKDICLWLKNVPPLISTCYNTKRVPVCNHVNGRMSQAQKSKIKSKFFPLVAEAMAHQWTEKYLLQC
jgi:hypothetical protein